MTSTLQTQSRVLVSNKAQHTHTGYWSVNTPVQMDELLKNNCEKELLFFSFCFFDLWIMTPLLLAGALEMSF